MWSSCGLAEVAVRKLMPQLPFCHFESRNHVCVDRVKDRRDNNLCKLPSNNGPYIWTTWPYIWTAQRWDIFWTPVPLMGQEKGSNREWPTIWTFLPNPFSAPGHCRTQPVKQLGGIIRSWFLKLNNTQWRNYFGPRGKSWDNASPGSGVCAVTSLGTSASLQGGPSLVYGIDIRTEKFQHLSTFFCKMIVDLFFAW